MFRFDLDKYNPKRTPDNQIQVVETDSPTLNKMLGGGLRTGNLYVLEALSGQGKTTFMMRLFINCLLAKKKVAFISVGEQSAEEILGRIACMYYSISYESFELDNTDEQCEKVNKFIAKYKDLIYIYYSEDLVTPYPARIDEEGVEPHIDYIDFLYELEKESVKFIFLDYLGAIYSNTLESQYSFLKKVAAWLKNKCTTNNVMIFTAMQMNGRTTEAALKEPDLDLKTINQTYMQDSVGPYAKASCCMSLFKYKEQRYINVFKNRLMGESGIGVFPINIRGEKYHYDWYEPGEWDLE